MQNPNLLNPSNLAFLGDAVYSLLVRERLSEVNRPSGKLHSLSVKFVCAGSQEKGFLLIEPLLTEQETAGFKRGRNMPSGSIPKAASSKTYHTATGLEVLFGWLYLKKELDRLNSLFSVIWEGICADNSFE